MRQFLLRTAAVLCFAACLTVSLPGLHAQDRITVSGTVTDEAGLPLVGLTVFVEGTTSGATTDLDGKYSIEVSPDAVLVFSYLGYRTQTVPVGGRSRIDLQLLPDTELLTDAVVIGYGTTTKKDMTGSISAVNSDDFNSGLISSPEQLINGKVSGVQITSSGGSPTSGSTIRIRGGASLNASNDPLIVLDGVPLESGGVSGMGTNFLSLINPADIESMTVLKDASSTAIYGSRASNGVVIITTKKGKSDKLAITFNTTLSLQNKTRVPDMLSPEQFVRVATDAGYENLLGDWETNGFTDWNDRIYQTAFGTDNNLSVAGQFTRNFPFRVSLGYYNQDGIVRTDNATRYTGNINLSPSFFDDHLKITLSAKGAINKNRYAQSGQAIYNATVGDPTRPVYSGNDAFGGYSEILMNGEPVTTGAAFNPLGLLEQYDSRENMKRVIANLDIDYKMHFLPEMKLHLTGGYDYASGSSEVFVPETAAQYYRQGGLYTPAGPNTAENRLFTAYLNYNKEIPAIKSRIDVTAGYDWQYWRSYISGGDSYRADKVTSLNSVWLADDQRHVLLSYYARLNWSFDGRYLLTATIRRDGSSRFAPDQRWGTFPSVALAWNIAQEKFLRDNKVLNNLKLRASFGGRLKFFGIGGAKLDTETENFLKKAGFPYAIGYGMTETAPLICNAGVRDTYPGTTGVHAYGVQVKLHNADPDTGIGEIVCKGENVMLGYYKDPERTASMFTSDGWFRTNDLACMDTKGRFSIKGRLNSVILGPSGENIYPEEIESVINGIAEVEESLVVQRGGRLVALIRLKDGYHAAIVNLKKEILDYVNRHVSRFARISEIEVLKEAFEKTATHKIRRMKYQTC